MAAPSLAGIARLAAVVAGCIALGACTGSDEARDDPGAGGVASSTPAPSAGDATTGASVTSVGSSGSSAPGATTTSVDRTEVLAVVNDNDITREQLTRAVAAVRFSTGGGGPVELGSDESALAMTNLIGLEMLRRPAAELGVQISPVLSGNSAAEEAQLLLLFAELGDALLGIESPDDAERVVDAHLATLAPGELPVCSRHIVVATEEQADAVIARLDDGDDFARLAATISADESAPFGGYLGCGPSAGFIPEFAEALDALDVGELSPPVETEFGFHVIRRDPLEPGARDQILGRLRNGLLGPWIDEAFESAAVTVDPRIGTWNGSTVVPPGG